MRVFQDGSSAAISEVPSFLGQVVGGSDVVGAPAEQFVYDSQDIVGVLDTRWI